MDPQIALQLLLTVAKISGTILAIFIAVVIFAIRDEDLARLILQGKPYGYGPLFAMSVTCFLLVVEIMASLVGILKVNLEEPYSDSQMMVFLALFFLTLAVMLVFLAFLLWDKRDFLKARAQILHESS